MTVVETVEAVQGILSLLLLVGRRVRKLRRRSFADLEGGLASPGSPQGCQLSAASVSSRDNAVEAWPANVPDAGED